MNWIKISDRMPQYDKKVLVYYKCPNDGVEHDHKLNEQCSEIYLGEYRKPDIALKETFQNSSKELYDQWSWAYKEHWDVPGLVYPELEPTISASDNITHWAPIEKPSE